MAATFTNQAKLNYNNNDIYSNLTTGTINTSLQATKNAIDNEYAIGDTITYSVSLINTSPTTALTVSMTDNMGLLDNTHYPLTYVTGNLLYYQNGVLTDPAPLTISGGNQAPLTIDNISVPAGGNAVLLYEVLVNNYAPLGTGAKIENTATFDNVITATEVITPRNEAILSINKLLNPTTVDEDGQVTYTFIIYNSGTSEIATTDAVVLSDSFIPPLTITNVTFQSGATGTPITWVEGAQSFVGTHYTYSVTTDTSGVRVGNFASHNDVITVPAGIPSEDSEGIWTVQEGQSTLTITGTLQ